VLKNPNGYKSLYVTASSARAIETIEMAIYLSIELPKLSAL